MGFIDFYGLIGTSRKTHKTNSKQNLQPGINITPPPVLNGCLWVQCAHVCSSSLFCSGSSSSKIIQTNTPGALFVVPCIHISKNTLKGVQFMGLHHQRFQKPFIKGRSSPILTQFKIHIKSTLKHVELTNSFTLVHLIDILPRKW